MDRIDPADPMLSKDPAEASDITDPADRALSTDSTEPADSADRELAALRHEALLLIGAP
jgi:hypothetical protein